MQPPSFPWIHGAEVLSEIKEWSCDFRAHPSEPGQAKLIHYFLFDPTRTAAAHQ